MDRNNIDLVLKLAYEGLKQKDLALDDDVFPAEDVWTMNGRILQRLRLISLGVENRNNFQQAAEAWLQLFSTRE